MAMTPVAGQRRSLKDLKVGRTAQQWPDKVRLSDMADNPDNPPARLDPEKLEELASSIRESGLLQRIVLVPRDVWLKARPEHDKPVGEGGIGDKPFVIGMGHRRRHACELAGLDEAPVDVRESADKARRDALIENIQRLNLSPMQEARQIEKLKSEEELSQNGVAKALGKTPAWVSQRLSLLDLIPEYQQAVDAGGLKVEDARRLSRLIPELQIAVHESRLSIEAGIEIAKLPKDEQRMPAPVPAPPPQQPLRAAPAGGGEPAGEGLTSSRPKPGQQSMPASPAGAAPGSAQHASWAGDEASFNEALRLERAANEVGNLRALRRVAMQHPEKARAILRVLEEAVEELRGDLPSNA
ncbi:ParB/RepB/Spo0J family partition protein [Nonomuraea gerenzanensis]|uniref:Chromosome (Plasmid) partitioning protein ParB / Stage 0 sporulation protein J n=1 Tax=Nonomuraea gerenzanensis TaxID=93944 RepID=A0A1M4BL16_9ACTN|nr:ParB/RepB/Spo0J family partition protein [Nonomuraea gerenzanensis]UBU19183.1 ParB/RepB/Spo0J family partition protein [Nonomuraea gerenzanensis]SAP16369.1 Chromosome (plasmid) partitioning protein ParB / Stage 0 sporulation protein J [Nonomuraea gerenzanensis]